MEFTQQQLKTILVSLANTEAELRTELLHLLVPILSKAGFEDRLDYLRDVEELQAILRKKLK